MNPQKTLVLFSGGRDSSCAVIEMLRAGYFVRLFTCQAVSSETTGPKGDSAPDIRQKELITNFPNKIDAERVIRKDAYLIRKLAISRTNKTHVVYPIAIALAIHSEAILYCLKNNIKNIACGYSGYQSKEDRYIEQSTDFFELMKSFLKEYGIEYHAPVINKTKKEINDILEQCNIESSSLENKSIFGDIEFDTNKALEFWNESIPVCRDYISKMQSFDIIKE
ncbi:MAG: 7-cyano-7-deazaguanine synthase [bacterium]